MDAPAARAHPRRTSRAGHDGIAARAGNGLLLAILALLILRAQGADERAIVIVVGCLVAVFAASFLDAAIHPERVRVGYKA